MELGWHKDAWEDYVYWINTDKKMIQRINELIKDILRSPYKGIGKPEPLKGQYSGLWSRRINDEHRLVCLIKEKRLIIIACRYHYEK